jgi:hypothetical protein
MRHPVMFLSEVAEAVTTTGEVTVALFAGVETVTLTPADANKGEIKDRTMASVHRITSFLLNSAVRSGGTFSSQLRIRRVFAFDVLRSAFDDLAIWRSAYFVLFSSVLAFRVFVRREDSNWEDDPISLGFFT